ncbi:hypothetical protein [Rosistilla oblonga]|uniref:hypothetical protein n=1 Tax=Rosistilla oblonga TaxID=2527990 RepID=UPI003A96FA24
MAKRFGFRESTTQDAIIFEIGSEAEVEADSPGTPGMVVGSSEWGWISEDNGRRICAALRYFSETSTEEIERLAEEKFGEGHCGK